MNYIDWSLVTAESYTPLLKGFEHLAPEAKEVKKPAFFSQIPLRGLDLIYDSIGLNLTDVLMNRHPELYQPTDAQLMGSVMGVHGHKIHQIATERIRMHLNYSHEEIESLYSLYGSIYDEWDAWRRRPGLEYHRHKARSKEPKKEGAIPAERVALAWDNPLVERFGRYVLAAHERTITNIVQDRNKHRKIPYNELHPHVDLKVESQFDGINFILDDDIGIQTSVRADYVLDGQTIMDCKFSETDPKSETMQMKAYLYCMVFEGKRRFPNSRTFDLRRPENTGWSSRAPKIDMNKMRFFLKIFDGRDYKLDKVEIDEASVHETLTKYTRIWKHYGPHFRRLQHLRDTNFYLPEESGGLEFLDNVQNNLFAIA